MAAQKKYTLGAREFSSKKAAEKHVGAILRDSFVGAPLPADDFKCVFDLLQHHPHANSKIGAGVAHIRVSIEQRWKSRHFEIVRVDGSTTDFSYKSCLTPPTKETLFRKACRHAIADQIISYRNAVLHAVGVENLRCPVLGVPLTLETLHVDHVPPVTFEFLVQSFIEQYSINVARVHIAGFNDHEMKKSFVDNKLTSNWQTFHRQHAKLRLVSCKANLSHIRRGICNGSQT
jgi:hypothetical protein